MKKLLCLMMTMLFVFSLSGCGETKENSEKKTAEKTSAVQQSTKEALNSDFDVDLTNLSSTMVYSEVYNMMTKPSEYKGKSVRMKGNFALYQNEEATQQYYACVIADATACCQQGIEFVLKGEHKYPEDYPEIGSEIIVSGIFETYYEGENMYCHLTDAELTA